MIHLHSQVLPASPLTTRNFPRPGKSISVLYWRPQRLTSAAPACLPDPQRQGFPSRHRSGYTGFLCSPEGPFLPSEPLPLLCPLPEHSAATSPCDWPSTWLTVAGASSQARCPLPLCITAPSRKGKLHKAGTPHHGCMFLTQKSA